MSKEEEMMITRYRGRIENFLQHTTDFECYLKGQENQGVEILNQLLPGQCTPQGTQNFKNLAIQKGIPAKNFRQTFMLPEQKQFTLSTVGLGTYVGKPDDEDDFDTYVAAKYLIQSGAINTLDTAINFRCQKAERSMGACIKSLVSQGLSREEIFIATKHGYVPDDAENGISASFLVDQMIEQGQITKEDVAGGIHCMHPNFLDHQLEASRKNLGLETIDLVYLSNSYEQQAHFISDEVYMDRLMKAFEFYEQSRSKGLIQYYGLSTWLCFRSKPDEDKIHLNFQKVVELANQVGGANHGLRFMQVPMSVLMPEAFVEKWQNFTSQSGQELKILVAIANLLQINLIASKPLLEGRVAEIDIPTIKMQDKVAKHVQLIRSLPPRCNISCMVGMKTLSKVKTNYNQVLTQEPLTREQFLKAMEVNK